MSNRLFQGLVHQMRDTIDATIGVVDETATIIACSDLTRVGTTNEFVSLDLSDSHDIFIRDGFTYKPFGSRVKPDYAVFVEVRCRGIHMTVGSFMSRRSRNAQLTIYISGYIMTKPRPIMIQARKKGHILSVILFLRR